MNGYILLQKNYIDITSLSNFQDEWKKMLVDMKNIKSIFLDCGELESITSMLIGEVVFLLNTTRKLGIELYLADVNSDIQKVLEKCQLKSLLKIISKEEFRKKYFIEE